MVNTLKHANARAITLFLHKFDGSIRLTVEDNGKGFVPENGSRSKNESGWGLTVMRERAEAVGGTFNIETIRNKGTSIKIDIEGCN